MKVLIRGMGAIGAPGDLPGPFGDALFSGTAALGPSGILPGAFAGEIRSFNPRAYIAQKGLQVLSRAALLATAVISVLRKGSAPLLDADPGAPPGAGACPPDRIGLVVGTASGHIESKARYSDEAHREGVALVSPILFPNTIINSLGGHAAIVHGWRGPNSTVTAGIRSGLEAVRYSAELLRAGRADRVAAVGCDEVSRPLLEGLRARGMLARSDPAGPEASVPLSPDRSGIYPAEASAAILLTRDEAAGEVPGSPPVLAAIAGSASASSVRRGVAGAAKRALALALEEAGIGPEGIGWTALSASGSVPLDAAEREAVAEILGADRPAAAIKRRCGETFGAGGILAIIAGILSLQRREIPPTMPAGGPEGKADFLLPGISPRPRPLEGPSAVLVSAVDEDGASAAVIAAFRPAGTPHRR